MLKIHGYIHLGYMLMKEKIQNREDYCTLDMPLRHPSGDAKYVFGPSLRRVWSRDGTWDSHVYCISEPLAMPEMPEEGI